MSDQLLFNLLSELAKRDEIQSYAEQFIDFFTFS